MIRPAVPADLPLVLALIGELATYECAPDAAIATEADLHAALFGDAPRTHCLIAEVNGTAVGFAVWFETFSTWKGRHGIYLEDLFVRPGHRGLGLGKALLAELARICVERGYPRLEWAVLDWNTPAIDFYRALGATPQEEWTTYRLSGDRLSMLADSAGRPT